MTEPVNSIAWHEEKHILHKTKLFNLIVFPCHEITKHKFLGITYKRELVMKYRYIATFRLDEKGYLIPSDTFQSTHLPGLSFRLLENIDGICKAESVQITPTPYHNSVRNVDPEVWVVSRAFS